MRHLLLGLKIALGLGALTSCSSDDHSARRSGPGNEAPETSGTLHEAGEATADEEASEKASEKANDRLKDGAALDGQSHAPVARFVASYSDLAALHEGCVNDAQTSKLSCWAAYENYCLNRGYQAGIGPLNYTPTHVELACFDDATVGRFMPLISEVQWNDCNPDQVDTLACKSAANRFCEKPGYVSGYGPTQKSSTHVIMICLKEGRTTKVHRNQAAVRLYNRLDFELAFASPSLSMVAANRTCKDEVGPSAVSIGIVEGNHATGDFVATCIGDGSPNPEITKLADVWNRYATPLTGAPLALDVACPNCGVNTSRITRPTQDNSGFSRQSDNNDASAWSIGQVLWQKNGDTYTPTFLGRVFDTRNGGRWVSGGADLVVAAFDPTSEQYANTKWVAFECAVAGSPTSNVCAGPFRNGQLNPADVRVLVRSIIVNGHKYSASVPKLLSHRGKLYLYWTQVMMTLTEQFVGLSTVGAEVHVGPGGTLHKPGGGSYYSVDGTIVMGGDGGTADVFDVVSDGIDIYATSARGGVGCVAPWSPYTECYAPYISKTSDPLALDTFKHTTRKMYAYSQVHEYSTFFFSEGRGGIYARYLKLGPTPGPLDGVLWTPQ